MPPGLSEHTLSHSYAARSGVNEVVFVMTGQREAVTLVPNASPRSQPYARHARKPD